MRKAWEEGGEEGGLCAIMHLSRAHPHVARGIVNLRAGTLSSCIEIVEARAIRFFDYQGKRKETTYVTPSRIPSSHESKPGAAVSVMGETSTLIRAAKMKFRERNFRKHPIYRVVSATLIAAEFRGLMHRARAILHSNALPSDRNYSN